MELPTVKFAYKLDERVETQTGVQGIISLLAVDRAGIIYHVKHSQGSDWFYEDQIRRPD